MRLNEWNIWEASPDPVPEVRPACRRWERTILLAVSGDLPARSVRSLDRHIKDCADCSREFRLARDRREICLELASRRGKHRNGQSLWAQIQSAIEARADSIEISPSTSALYGPCEGLHGPSEGMGGELVGEPRLGWKARLRRISLLAATLLVVAWVAFHVSGESNGGLRALSTPQGEERWAAQWSQFVSSVDPQGDFARELFSTDPLISDFPVPEVIDF